MTLREKHDKRMSTELRVRVNNLSDLLGLINPSQVNELLEYGALRHCADPRDRIYALLGIADPRFAGKIRPQYTLSKAHVYAQAVLAHVEVFRNLELMLQCCIVQWEKDLPTWVPNWAGPRRPNASGSFYWASGMSSAHVQFLSPNILEVIGVKVAEVSLIGIPRGKDLDDTIEASGLRMQSNSPEILYVTGETRSRAIASSLVVNRTVDRFPQFDWYPPARDVEHVFCNRPMDTSVFSPSWFPRTVRYLVGRVYYETDTGYVGVGFKGIEPGKAAALDCFQVIDSRNRRYRISLTWLQHAHDLTTKTVRPFSSCGGVLCPRSMRRRSHPRTSQRFVES